MVVSLCLGMFAGFRVVVKPLVTQGRGHHLLGPPPPGGPCGMIA